MESLWENKALLYALSATGSFILILALGWLPELDEQFGIIEFPQEVWQTNIKQIPERFYLKSLKMNRMTEMKFHFEFFVTFTYVLHYSPY